MANPEQTWARDPESGGGEGPAHPTTPGDSQPYADTNRFGKTQTGDTTPIKGPMNRITDPVWGVQAPTGGTPAAPEID
jgi:hypothetical protein